MHETKTRVSSKSVNHSSFNCADQQTNAMELAPLVFVILFSFGFFGKSRSNLLAIKSLECKAGKELCQNSICATGKTRNRVDKINCSCYIPRPLYNLTANVKLQQKAGGKFKTLFNAKEMLCDVTNKSIRNQLMATVFQNVGSVVTNFKCPFHGNISAINMPLSISYPPGFLKPAVYRVVCLTACDGELVMDITINFAVQKIKIHRGK